MDWFNSNRGVYFGNATSTRDFRVQLRGNRSALLFGTYLVLLIGVAMLVYVQAVGDQRMSVVEAQRHLQTFYTAIMMLLAGTICMVAPALSATTVVLEKQRRSLDLVFSAPVSPKYYLVGKMLSSYRYIWMLLVLSLPVTAACVVLGGASWSDVLGSYILLSTQTLVLTSLSLLMSTLAPKPVSAVLWSYAICIPYLIITAAGASSTLFAFGHRSMEAPFIVAMNPFFVIYAVGTHTVVNGINVPNWIPALLMTLLITKISLLCAGSLLNPAGKEAKSLRIHGLVYTLAAMAFMGYFSASVPGSDMGRDFGRVYAWTFMPLIVALPFMTCYGFDAENRFRPNGIFKIKGLFQPTPATALPYLATLLVGSAVTLVAGGLYRISAGPFPISSGWIPGRTMLTSGFFIQLAFTLAFWGFFWSIGRFTSSLGAGLRTARTLQFAAFLLVCAVPVPLIASLDHTNGFDDGVSLWTLWPLKSMFSSNQESTNEAMVYATIFLLLAIPISLYAEARLKEMVQKRDLKMAEPKMAA
jgi:hypothetical protein